MHSFNRSQPAQLSGAEVLLCPIDRSWLQPPARVAGRSSDCVIVGQPQRVDQASTPLRQYLRLSPCDIRLR
eukprot:scaffold89081_cov14-Prasinocladus_malaysianus.AAC.1